MLISSKNLIGLPAYTRSGQHLGKVQQFLVDCDSQVVARYLVKASSLPAKLLGDSGELAIAPSQVISISEERIVVEDAAAKEAAGGESTGMIKERGIAPAMSSRSDG